MKTGIRMAVAMVTAVSSGAMAAPFSVSSNDMRDGQPLAQQHWFAGFGCTGGNVSPQLAWKNAPAGTRSFVRRREINRTAIALRYGRWMSPRCRWMPGPAGRWSAICYIAMLSPAHS